MRDLQFPRSGIDEELRFEPLASWLEYRPFE
jgi:hypothetical protein